jgi:4-hydroxy-tetrahydrodipicolinate synthase
MDSSCSSPITKGRFLLLTIDSFKGVFPALVTPLTPEETIDRETLKVLICRMVDSNVNGIVILGSSGEGAVLPANVQEEIIEEVVEMVAGKIPVVVGIGGLSTAESIRKCRTAKQLGASGVLLLPPFYYSLPQQEVICYYQSVADKIELPVIIYNIPQLTKIAVSPETVAILCRHANIIGLKDSSGNFIAFQNMVYASEGESFHLFQGAAPLALAGMFIGAKGWISPVANIDPATEIALYAAWCQGDLTAARQLQKKMNQWAKVMNHNGHPVGVNAKALLYLTGIGMNVTLRPSPVMDEAELNGLDQLVEAFGLKDAGVECGHGGYLSSNDPVCMKTERSPRG